MVTERDDIHMLVAGHAVGALDPDDEELFERHLAVCDRCRAALASLEDAAAALAGAVEPVSPPAGLRERVLEQARGERANVIPLRRRGLSLSVAYGAAAVAACAALAFGLWVASLSRSLDRERDARRAQERALTLLAEPGSREAALRGANGVLVRQSSGEAALIVSRLASAPNGKAYEAWVIPSGARPQRAGLFRGGDRLTVVRLERPLPARAQVVVTIERKNGVDAPTGKSVFGGAVSNA
jgi:anti-sigma-K factor RskA